MSSSRVEQVLEEMLGVAEETDRALKNVLNQIIKNLQSYYELNNELKLNPARLAMVTSEVNAQAKEFKEALDKIQTENSERNNKITNIGQSLAQLQGEVPAHARQAYDSMNKSLSDLDNQNKTLQKIHEELHKLPFVTGAVSSNANIEKTQEMAMGINRQLESLSANNKELVEKLKSERQATMKVGMPKQTTEPTEKMEKTNTGPRPGGRRE